MVRIERLFGWRSAPILALLVAFRWRAGSGLSVAVRTEA